MTAAWLNRFVSVSVQLSGWLSSVSFGIGFLVPGRHVTKQQQPASQASIVCLVDGATRALCSWFAYSRYVRFFVYAL